MASGDTQPPEGNPSETPAPPKTEPKPQSGIRSLLAAIGGGLAGIVIAVALISGYTRYAPTTQAVSAGDPALTPTESRFQDSVTDAGTNTDLINEWRAARSDHKIIAYAIARCENLDVTTMSPNLFSLLMLDLKPNGDHFWRASANRTREPDASAAPTTLRIGNYQMAMLALSDAISRARIAAAAGAGGFYPQMWGFGWLTVIVSALATMVVTLRASMGQATGWFPRAASIFAILFSTAATVLTGAKQFWDPTSAYMRNETALLALKQLHQEVVLTFVSNWDATTCQLPDAAATEQSYNFLRWKNTLVSLQIGTMPAPVIVPNQASGPDPSSGAGNGSGRETSARPPAVFGVALPPANAPGQTLVPVGGAK